MQKSVQKWIWKMVSGRSTFTLVTVSLPSYEFSPSGHGTPTLVTGGLSSYAKPKWILTTTTSKKTTKRTAIDVDLCPVEEKLISGRFTQGCDKKLSQLARKDIDNAATSTKTATTAADPRTTTTTLIARRYYLDY